MMLKTSFLKSYDRGEPNPCTWDARECSLVLYQHIASHCTSACCLHDSLLRIKHGSIDTLASRQKEEVLVPQTQRSLGAHLTVGN